MRSSLAIRAGLLLLLSLVCLNAAATTCVYQRDVTYIDWFDGSGYHSYTIVSYTLLYCEGEGGGGGGIGGPGGGGGFNPPPPSPPSVQITDASDENPNQVTLGFNYSGNPTEMVLFKDSNIVSSGAPSTSGFYGSLDNMVSPTSSLMVRMCNSAGCAEDIAFVHRSTQRHRAEGAISAPWADFVPSGNGVDVIVGRVNYTRILEGEFFYADYSVATRGTRNGRVQHVQTSDALLWEEMLQKPPVWVTTWRMSPYWNAYEQRFEAGSYPGCYLAQSRFPYSDVQCTIPAEFARDGSGGGGVIESVIGASSAPLQAAAIPPFGALSLDIQP